jgi:hypothetical protein
VNSWCERWKRKINEGKTQAVCFSRIVRVPFDVLLLNGRDIPFVNNVTYLDVTFDRKMIWRDNIERAVAKALGMYIRTYSLLRSGRLSTNIKLTLHKALTRSVMPVPPGSMRRTLILEIAGLAEQSAPRYWKS